MRVYKKLLDVQSELKAPKGRKTNSAATTTAPVRTFWKQSSLCSKRVGLYLRSVMRS